VTDCSFTGLIWILLLLEIKVTASWWSSWIFIPKFNLPFPCFITGQRVEIDVNHEPEETAPSSIAINKAFWGSILGCFLLLILSIVIFTRFLDKPERSQQTSSSVTTTTSIAAPTTPDRSNPSVVNDSSPRTPQPFVDYVRRTIDETPYYKREGRRRVNPQNTF